MEQKNRRISTRQLVSMAMLGAISIVLVAVIHFPLIPAAAFLEYDPADIPILICAFAYGPLAGLLLTVVVCFIQGFTVKRAERHYRHCDAHFCNRLLRTGDGEHL